MIRMLMAAVVAAMLTACASLASAQVVSKPTDPWASMRRWDHSRPGVEKLQSGVEFYSIARGDRKSARPTARDRVEVRYEGRLADSGRIFDSSDGKTLTFSLDDVIPGWRDAVMNMRPGDVAMFWIPADQAYGERGRSYDILPNAALMYRVTLVRVSPDPWPNALPWPTGASDIVRLPSGLEYRVIDTGAPEGRSPTDADIAMVHFVGRLDDPRFHSGKTLEERLEASLVASTHEDGAPKMFSISDLTSGWNEVIKLMRPGDRWIVRMPPHLLYSNEGDGSVPPDATVIYEIELLDIVPS
jgi:FKBP-type peptidyl-prolyl cis-trans isomerase